jgi:hypothetical protein
MPYKVPASKKSLKQNQFEFEIDGVTYSVPLLKFVKPKIAFALDGATSTGAVQALFDEYLPEAFDKFEDAEQLEAFMAAWQEASGITAGESSASADS